MVPPELQAQLSRVADGLAGALEDLQEISRDIHPAILARGGLAAALKILARRSAVPVELEVRAGTRLPEPVRPADPDSSASLTALTRSAGRSKWRAPSEPERRR
jgi:signal transduction histidine kinase